MPRTKDPERIYYEALFEALDIPFITRRSPNSMGIRDGITYFINPITGRQNDLSLGNLRRSVEQMIETGVMTEEIRYDPDIEEDEEDKEETDNYSEYETNDNEEEIESKNSYESPTFSTVRSVLKANKGSLVRIVLYKSDAPFGQSYRDGDIILDKTYRVPEIGFGGFWQELSTFDLMVDSDKALIPYGTYGGDYLNHTYTLEAFVIQEITGGQPINQRFNDGLKQCILYPIKSWAKGCYDTSKSKSSKSRYNAKLKKIEELLIEYKDGVPETEIQQICELLQVDIKVDLPLDITEPYIYCKSTKKRLKTFEFINTRLHHVDINPRIDINGITIDSSVDLNEIVSTKHIKNISRDEIYELKNELDAKCQYYIYKKDMRGISSLTSFEGKYTINSKYNTVSRDFEEKAGFNYLKIDDVDDGGLSAFVKAGTHYNATIDFKDIYQYSNTLRGSANQQVDLIIKKKVKPLSLSVKHIDMEKAYANFGECKWFEGFMGKITDFRKTNKIVEVGLYLVETFDFTNSNTKLQKYNDIMRIYCDNNIYGSPELKMLSSFGVKYTITAGCWGVKTFDFRFNDDMKDNKDEDNIRFYARWTGGCDQHKLEQSFYMRGNYDLFQNIRNYVSHGSVRWVGVDEGCISYKKIHNYHLGHITAQITMYQRLNVIEQLLEMDITKIIRVCVDGIYHIEHDFKIKNVFRNKDDLHFGNEAGDRFASNIFIETDDRNVYDFIGKEFADEREHFGKELHLGAGGTGKTHKALTDKGLIRVLYVAPSRKLVRKKNAEYAITSDVLANLIINDSGKYDKIVRFFNVLVLDEVSMYSEQSKRAIFKRFDSHKLIFCGDIGYQLPSWGEDQPIIPDGFDKIFNHTYNYRIKCNELKKLCDMLRTLIRKGIVDNRIDNWKYKNYINKKVERFFIDRNRMIDKDELRDMYDIKDYILVGTKEVGLEYTDMFKGKFNEEKYYVKSNTNEFSNGDIVFNKVKPSGCNSEIRHHFTTHSIQGETIGTNIFIDCSKMFDSRMFYTAISRARKLDQIYLVC